MRFFKLTDIDDSRLTLILLNGGGQPPYNKFHRLVKFCISYDVNLISVELPGHGKSPFQGNVTAHEMLTQFFGEFMEYTSKFSRIALIGYSLGGLLALKAIEHTPDLFDFVIALGAPIRISDAEEEKMKYYTTREFFEKMRWLPNMLEYHERGWRELLVSMHEMLYAGSEIFMTKEGIHDLASPIYLIIGDNDEVANYKLHEKIVETSKYLTLTVLPHTSHFDYFMNSWVVLQTTLKEILSQKIS